MLNNMLNKYELFGVFALSLKSFLALSYKNLRLKYSQSSKTDNNKHSAKNSC